LYLCQVLDIKIKHGWDEHRAGKTLRMLTLMMAIAAALLAIFAFLQTMLGIGGYGLLMHGHVVLHHGRWLTSSLCGRHCNSRTNTLQWRNGHNSNQHKQHYFVHRTRHGILIVTYIFCLKLVHSLRNKFREWLQYLHRLFLEG